MTEEKTGSEETPLRNMDPLKLESRLQPQKTFGMGRLFLYGAVLVLGGIWILTRSGAPARPVQVFLHTDSIQEFSWPDARMKLVRTDNTWHLEHEQYGRIPADESRVLVMLHLLKNARGLVPPRRPPEFRHLGRMVLVTPSASRTLSWYVHGTDAIVESGGHLYLLPHFAADRLFPAAGQLVSRQLLDFEPGTVSGLTLPVITAQGERRYRIHRENDLFYISGPPAHLLHSPAVEQFLKELSGLTFRSLLEKPATDPENPDISLLSDGRQLHLARVDSACPEGETALARFDGTWLAGCVATSLWTRLKPVLPALLEAGLLPSTPGFSWDGFVIREANKPELELRKAPEGWRMGDGRAADELRCQTLLDSWGGTSVLGLEQYSPEEDEKTAEITFFRGNVLFTVRLFQSGEDNHFAMREQEGKKARIPPNLARMVRANPEYWLDRRVFPSPDFVRIRRSSGKFQETWHRQENSWRLLEPLEFPYPENFAEVLTSRLFSLRQTEGSVSFPETTPEPVPVEWILEPSAGETVHIRIQPDGTVFLGPNEEPTRLHLTPEDVAFLQRPFHYLTRWPWPLADAREGRFRLEDGRQTELSLHDTHWLLTAGKKRILSESSVKDLFRFIQKELTETEPFDMGKTSCTIRFQFASDSGLPQEFCMEKYPDFLLVHRPPAAGRFRLPSSFLEGLLQRME